MNEEFQKYLMNILEKTGEFLGAEIPEIAHQILAFNMASSILYLIVSILVITIVSIGYKKLWVSLEESFEVDRTMGRIFGGIFSLVAVGSMLSTGVSHIDTILKIWLAPKVYLLEYASSLVK